MTENNNELPSIEVKRLTGNEFFFSQKETKPLTVNNFWQWFGSDLTNNVIRGALAEFIVASALEIADEVRDVWSPFDLLSKKGVKVEVKSASYLQTWYQKSYSPISFDISQTRGYDSQTNKFASEIKRQADIYVFCLLACKDKTILNPLNLDQWEFFVLPTSIFNEKHLTQQKISLSGLLKLNPKNVRYEEIAFCIDKYDR